jgi:UDP-GlcNAc:undecaprenyl-phosphate/decaprenyl-phosphate GlcNAc-1-phosphate transferase
VTFPFDVYAAAIVSAAIITLGATPLWRKWCLRTGLVDEPGERKIHEQPIPLAGGLGVVTGILVPLAVACAWLWWWPAAGFDFQNSTSNSTAHAAVHFSIFAPNVGGLLLHGLSRRAFELLAIAAGAVGILAVGWLDDKLELRPAVKFGGQLIVAFLVAASGARINLFVPNIIFSYAATMLWILTIINALNFMDNMNGLCAGLGAIGAWYFAVAAAADGQYLVALIAFLTFGALLGFIPYNFPRARAFLGDAGSHLVGYLLAILAILPHFSTPRRPNHLAVLIPLFVLAVPLFDMVWVVLLRSYLGRPFYVGDTNHLSHRLTRAGFSRTQAVLVIWLVAAFCGGLGCWLLG